MTELSLQHAFDVHGVTDPDERKKITEVVRTFCTTQRRHFTECADNTEGYPRIINFIRADTFEISLSGLQEYGTDTGD